MTKLDKLLTTAAFTALLAGGLAIVPQEAFAAGSKNPCAPASMKVSNPCAPKATKAANPCAPKAMSDDKTDKSGKSRGKFDYPLLLDYLAKPQG